MIVGMPQSLNDCYRWKKNSYMHVRSAVSLNFQVMNMVQKHFLTTNLEPLDTTKKPIREILETLNNNAMKHFGILSVTAS